MEKNEKNKILAKVFIFINYILPKSSWVFNDYFWSISPLYVHWKVHKVELGPIRDHFGGDIWIASSLAHASEDNKMNKCKNWSKICEICIVLTFRSNRLPGKEREAPPCLCSVNTIGYTCVQEPAFSVFLKTHHMSGVSEASQINMQTCVFVPPAQMLTCLPGPAVVLHQVPQTVC